MTVNNVCPSCNGSGRVEAMRVDHDNVNGFVTQERDCFKCYGTGNDGAVRMRPPLIVHDNNPKQFFDEWVISVHVGREDGPACTYEERISRQDYALWSHEDRCARYDQLASRAVADYFAGGNDASVRS